MRNTGTLPESVKNEQVAQGILPADPGRSLAKDRRSKHVRLHGIEGTRFLTWMAWE